MSMEPKRVLKMAIVAILTTFVIYIMIISIQQKTITELGVFETIELFIAIPLLTVLYYWLISSKFDEFNRRMNRVMEQLELEEEELTGEEKTLRQEIRELKEILNKMEEQTREMKRQVKRKR